MGRFGDWQQGPVRESVKYKVIYQAKNVISSITVVSKEGKEGARERVLERIMKKDPLAKVIDIRKESLIIRPDQIH